MTAQDFRHAWRALRRRPGYALATVATLAVVLGSNAAIFAAISASWLRPLPFHAGDATVLVHTVPPGSLGTDTRAPLRAVDLVRVREHTRTLAEVAAFAIDQRMVTGTNEPRTIRVAAVNAGLWTMLDVVPSHGRTFTHEEDTPDAAVAVLTSGGWQRLYGQRADASGGALVVNGRPFTIIGILPPSFAPTFLDVDLIVPLGIVDRYQVPIQALTYLRTIARLQPSASVEDANAEIAGLMNRLEQEFPDTHRGWSGGVIPLRTWLYGGVRVPLLILFAATVALLLIASANIGTLTLAHLTFRRGEFAVRRALGAGTGSIVRLVLAETVLLSAAGMFGAVLLAHMLLPVVLAIDPAATRVLDGLTVDWRVTGYTMASAALAGAIAAGVPLTQLVRTNLTAGLLEGSTRSHGTRGARRWRATLLVTQAALCMALLAIGAGLLKTLSMSKALTPGFDADHVMTAKVRIPRGKYSTVPARADLVERVLDRVREIPGMESASAAQVDFQPGLSWVTTVDIEHQPTPDGTPHTVQFRRVGTRYFETLRIGRVAGRLFDATDATDHPPVVVVNETFARRFWPAEDAVGRRVLRAKNWLTVVGIVADTRDVDLTQAPEPTVYLPWSQTNTEAAPLTVLARTKPGIRVLEAQLRAAIGEVEPAMTLDNVVPLTTFLDESLAPQRFRSTLLAVLGAVGLLLGAIGVAGLTARTIQERMSEFGIRMALGSARRALWVSAITHPLKLVALGIAVGLPLAFMGGRALESLLPGTERFHLLTAAAAAMVLVGVAVAAAALPARRLLRTSAIDMLRR